MGDEHSFDRETPPSELEGALLSLGHHLDFPATPDIASAVRRSLDAPRLSRAESPWFPDSWSRYWLPHLGVAFAVVLIAVVVAISLLPGAGAAIAHYLGLPGVLITWIDEPPPPSPSGAGARLMLGRSVTLAEAQSAVDFPIVIPSAAGWNQPPEIYLSGETEGAMITFVYPAGPLLPPSSEPGIGALLTQFRGETTRGLIEKGLPRSDDDENQARVEPVSVAGAEGYWISGAPHALFFVCFDPGECRQERYRLAGTVLLWVQDGLTLRLESSLSQDEAVALASSVTLPD